MSDIRKTLDIISEMTAGSVVTVAAPLFKETIKREKPTKVKEGEKKYMNSVERTPNDWGNWADSNKKTVKEAWEIHFNKVQWKKLLFIIYKVDTKKVLIF